MASTSPAGANLTPAQLRALFDILNHNETYREAESFKDSRAIREYGYPFAEAEKLQRNASSNPTYHPRSSSPLLQLVLTRCILKVPGMSDLPPDFWPYNFQGIMAKLAEANLSESYDKGTLGTRKTLATGASVIHEALTRGLLAGVPQSANTTPLKDRTYDVTQASELDRAWDECVQQLIHGGLADELFDHFMTTPDIEAHSPAVAAAAEYSILHLATLLHHVFVLSAEGQYLLKLIENVFKLIPFSLVRQTLRIGNAATMIQGMTRVFLAKMSLGTVTNWMGLTSGADDGMNLLQRIISMVVSWDASEFRKQASQIETAKEPPTKEQFAALKDHLAMPVEVQRARREMSMTQQKSIVAIILEQKDPELMTSLTESQHTQCLAWLSATLSARDRDQITNVLCKSNPDYLTAVVRSFVDTYEPFIQMIHESMDLREQLTAIETFLSDFIETSKPKKMQGGWRLKWSKTEETRPPSVEDYVALIRRNKGLLFNYLYQFAVNCTDLREQFRDWAHLAIDEFNLQHDSTRSGGVSEKLQDMYTDLPAETQTIVLGKLDAHDAYLSSLDDLSSRRMQRILDQLDAQPSGDEKSTGGKTKSSRASSKSSSPPSQSDGGPSMSGPGVYLMRWDSLLDETLVTPGAPRGPPRRGRDIKGQKAWGKTTVAEGVRGGWDAGAVAREEDRGVPEAPDTALVVEALGERFRTLVNEAIGEVVPAVRQKVGCRVNHDAGMAGGGAEGIELAAGG